VPPVNRHALIGVALNPPVPLGIDEVVVVVLVDGEVVGVDVLEGNGGMGGAGCGPTQAVTSAATAATTTTAARACRDGEKAALVDIPSPSYSTRAGLGPERPPKGTEVSDNDVEGDGPRSREAGRWRVVAGSWP